MRALLVKMTGRNREGDPINIHVTVFWATVAFWAIASSCFAIVKAIG